MKLATHLGIMLLTIVPLGCSDPASTIKSQSEASAGSATTAQQRAPGSLAIVLGKQLTLEDLRPASDVIEREGKSDPTGDAGTWLHNHRGEALQHAVLSELSERYVADHHLEATASEIAEFERAMNRSDAMSDALSHHAADLRKQLADPKLSPSEHARITDELAKVETSIKEEEAAQAGSDWPGENDRREMRARSDQLREELKNDHLSRVDRKQLESELAYNARFQNLTDEQAAAEWTKFKAELSRQLAAPFIETWKFNRALYKQYGGRIIWQQAGIEPIDALRMWLKEQEKAGRFAIYEPDLIEPFWRSFTRDQQFVIQNPTGHEFDTPWWLQLPSR